MDAIQDGFMHYQLLRICQTWQYSNTLIAKLMTPSWKRVLINTQMVGTHLGRPGHMVIHLPHTHGGFGVTSNDVTKDAALHTTTLRFVAKNNRACGCPRTICRTRPHGHRPRFCSSVISTPSFFPTVQNRFPHPTPHHSQRQNRTTEAWSGNQSEDSDRHDSTYPSGPR